MAAVKWKPETPDDFLALAQTNPVVHEFVRYWRNGDMTFEQCLVCCVMALSRKYDQLLAIEQQRSMREPAPFIITADGNIRAESTPRKIIEP